MQFSSDVWKLTEIKSKLHLERSWGGSWKFTQYCCVDLRWTSDAVCEGSVMSTPPIHLCCKISFTLITVRTAETCLITWNHTFTVQVCAVLMSYSLEGLTIKRKKIILSFDKMIFLVVGISLYTITLEHLNAHTQRIHLQIQIKEKWHSEKFIISFGLWFYWSSPPIKSMLSLSLF